MAVRGFPGASAKRHEAHDDSGDRKRNVQPVEGSEAGNKRNAESDYREHAPDKRKQLHLSDPPVNSIPQQ